MKRIICLLLALVMLVGILPFQVFAEGKPVKPETEAKVENQKPAEEKSAEKPEVVEEKTEENKILQNQAKETEELELGPEIQEDPVGEGNNLIEVTFVRKDGTEETVQFIDKNQQLGLNGTPSQTGSWFFKTYFIGWSNNKDYIKNGEGLLLYETATVDDLLKETNGKSIKLYALYASASMSNIVKDSAVMINDDVAGKDFVNFKAEDVKKTGDETTVNIRESDLDNDSVKYEIKALKSEFEMNKFTQAAIYKDPWVGALENGSNWGDLSKKSGKGIDGSESFYGKVTVVDLHVHVDERLVLPDEFDLSFTSYTFRPYSVFSEINADGTVVKPGEVYPYLGFPGEAGERYGVLESIKDNEPKTTFKVKSYLINDVGKKVPVHDFVVRTRIRIGYDNYGKKIIPATMEQIQSNMLLELASGTFEVPKEEAFKIAKGQADPITIRGYINGTVKGIPIQGYGEPDDKIKSEDEILTFKIAEEEKTILNLDENYPGGKVAKHELDKCEEAGKYLYNPSHEGYEFVGWNYKVDGSGDFVKATDQICENTTVYAIWKAQEKPQAKPEKRSGGLKFNFSTEEIEKHIAYIFGYEDNTVRANGNLTRAEAAAMVTRLAKLDLSNTSKADYKDLEDNAWYLPYINAALKAGMIDAEDNNLRPNENISRGEFAKMLAAVDKDNDYVSNFSDVKGHKYEKEINKIDGNKRIEGYEDGSFRPDAFLTRAEAATFLNRMYNRVADDLAIESFKNSIAYFKDLNKDDWFYYEIVEASNTHELTRRGSHDKYRREFEKWTNLIK